MMKRRLVWAWLCVAAACASPVGGNPSHDLSGGDGSGGDLAGAPCIGTADSCGATCSACPGTDSAGTMRLCTSPDRTGTCDISCKGDFYDLDGVIDNGCEASDPRHDDAAHAIQVTLPAFASVTTVPPCDNTNNPCNEVEEIYGDTRDHDTAPTRRPNGLDDLYQVNATGTGSGAMKACLSISNFSADNRYQVCISGAGSVNPADHCSATLAMGGGTGVCVPATGTLPSTGTFLVRVRRMTGSNTFNRYALYLEH